MESFKSTGFCSPLPNVSKIPKSKCHFHSRKLGAPNISHFQDFDIDVLCWSLYNLIIWERLELGKIIALFFFKSAITNTQVRNLMGHANEVKETRFFIS